MEVKTSGEAQPLGEAAISKMIKDLQENSEIEKHLPGGGYLHMSGKLPYLVIYRLRQNLKDSSTIRFVLSEASFLIVGNEDFEGYQRLMFSLAEKMSSRFKSFLMIELYSGEPDCSRFKIKGPGDRLPSTLKVLQNELTQLNDKYRVADLEKPEIDNNIDRQLQGEQPLLELRALKDSGALLLGLEIPPVYLSEQGEEYPVFFRNFKDDLVHALHQGIFEFIRIQTSSGVKSYRALGQSKLQEKVLEIDRQLAEIEMSYQFLWLISPSNIRNIKDTFFASNYEKVLHYHYRLLPFDPDVHKRQLYNLPIEEIDDPALSYIFREKREELDLQIGMLTGRDSKNFFYRSMMLFGNIGKKLQKEAENLLKEVPEEKDQEVGTVMKAKDFQYLAYNEFDYFKEQDNNFSSKVHVRDDVNILMVSQGELYIPIDYKMNGNESRALIQHEVGTHVLTYYNGRQQPLKLLSVGLTDYDTLQEGLAVMAEYFVGGLTANRMRTLAGRVVAAAARMHGANFQEIFRLLNKDYGFSPERSFNITSRIMQGGGFTKDISYLKGLLQLKEHLEKGGEIAPLLTGKFSLEHVPIIDELRERKVLKPVNIVPRYLGSEETKEKISLIRKGLPLSKMING